MIPTLSTKLPRITTEEMIEVDRLMIEEYGILLMQMMENAGRCLAILARDRFLEGRVGGRHIAVLAGTGGNGGGALVAARRLRAWGAKVSVFLSKPEGMREIPQHQLGIVQRMGVPVSTATELPQDHEYDLILDGIIGYSIQGNPRGNTKALIEWANQQATPTLSLDTPSGLDLTSGTIYSPTIAAAATLTLALPKHGLFAEGVAAVRGELYLGDISVPPALYAEPSLG
ncbi:MAG: NAD(P)H-hydrate epimerase, partial [Bacteroidota bacterium]